MRYEELDVNATYFVLLGWGNSTHWCECKLEPYIFSGFDYKLYAVPIKNDRNGINRKESFYTSDFVSLLKEHNGVFKKEPGTSEVKHIKWQERVYKDAYVCHEADILI